ncbi:pyridoxamine 5'-phosphate oxidase [Porticoccaceae bacterium LTM1]|nr:pyridoxamine 5'-phosphate oxidase [Porticoccaceae bacterium LTM1]
MSLEHQRREYAYGKLTRESLADSPYAQFDHWMKQAIEAEITDPTAMCVATAGADGRLWQRMVLLKGFDEQGFVFYTNLGSRKARDIANNPNVSLHFPWLALDRQVIVSGKAEKLSKAQVLKYFLKRPRESQLGAWASQQSSRISSRQVLEAEYGRIKAKFSKGEIPVPDFWGGFRVIPNEFEFWQGGEHRLHDRFQYLLQDGEWQIERLAP